MTESLDTYPNILDLSHKENLEYVRELNWPRIKARVKKGGVLTDIFRETTCRWRRCPIGRHACKKGEDSTDCLYYDILKAVAARWRDESPWLLFAKEED